MFRARNIRPIKRESRRDRGGLTMAKRRRLSLPDPVRVDTPRESSAETTPAFPLGVARHGPATPSSPPIAQVAGEAASASAFADLAEEVARAREEGRLIQALALDAIDEAHLVRDRLAADEDELESLIQSIRTRGQQNPIEVVALGQGRYGLISGWRRLTALRRLRDEVPGDARFATIQAVLRRPDTAADAYLAMVEENEIRVGLSYYERARIVARAAELGVFPDAAAALSALFASASRAKRSKIGSFLRLHAALDDRLRFAAAIPERLGLSVVKALDADPGFLARLRDRLRKTPPAGPSDELAALESALHGRGTGADKSLPPAVASKPVRAVPVAIDEAPVETVTRDISITAAPGRLVLEGPGVTSLLQARLTRWLQEGSWKGRP